MQVVILILLSRELCTNENRKTTDTKPEREFCVCNVVRLPAMLKITIIIKFAYYEREEKIHSHIYIEIKTKCNFHPMWTRTWKMQRFLFSYDNFDGLDDGVWVSCYRISYLHYKMPCNFCRTIILLFAPNKLPVNDSQCAVKLQPSTVLLHTIKFTHSTNRCMNYEFHLHSSNTVSQALILSALIRFLMFFYIRIVNCAPISHSPDIISIKTPFHTTSILENVLFSTNLIDSKGFLF